MSNSSTKALALVLRELSFEGAMFNDITMARILRATLIVGMDVKLDKNIQGEID